MQVEPLGGRAKNFVVTLPGRGGRFFVQLEGYKDFNHSGLDRIDGKSSMDNETNVRGELLKRGQLNQIMIQVRVGAIAATVNGRRIVNWRGDFSRLSVDSGWEEPGRSTVLLGAYQSRFAIHSAVLTPLGSPLSPLPYPPMSQRASAWRQAKLTVAPTPARQRTIFLDEYPESSFNTAWGTLGKRGYTGFPNYTAKQKPQTIRIGGAMVDHAVAMHPPTNGYSRVTYQLGGRYRRFASQITIGEDPNRKPDIKGSLTFRVYGDGKLLAEKPEFRRRGSVQSVDVDVSGVKTLTLTVACRGESSSAWAAWVSPTLEK